MIIDIHGHLGNINQAPFWAANASELDRYCERAGVDFLCVSSAKSLMYDTVEGNADLAQALRSSKRLLGYVVVNPVFPETRSEVERLKDDPKMKGVKVHPDYHGYDMASKEVVAFLDGIAEQVRLMLFHVSCMPGAGFAAAMRIARFAERHPGTNFVLAHIAGIFQNNNYPYFPNLRGCEEVSELGLDNVYIDTAHYLMYVYPGVIEKVVALAGADHVVFGSDTPLQGPAQMRFAIETIRESNMSQSDKDKILGLNARRLLEL